MLLKKSPRRYEISELEAAHQWRKLEKLGLRIVGRSAQPCFRYVLDKLEIPYTNSAVATLCMLPRTKRPVPGIVCYREETTVPLHFGIYDGRMVYSKWENGPVFEHAIKDVPFELGNIVEFTELERAKKELGARSWPSLVERERRIYDQAENLAKLLLD